MISCCGWSPIPCHELSDAYDRAGEEAREDMESEGGSGEGEGG